MKIINLLNNAYTNYIILFEDEAILIDCGFAFSYEKFLKKLKKYSIDKSMIKTVVLTHIHQDHLSYLQELLDDVHPKVILGKGGVENLALGHDKLLTYSSKFNKWLTEFSAKLRGGPAKWNPIDITKYDYVEVIEDDSSILSKFNATVVTLPGHTLDSIGLRFDDIFIVGDAIMPMFPAKHCIPLLIEGEDEFKSSINKLLTSKCKQLYTGHGGVIPIEKLKEEEKIIKDLHII